MSQPEVDVLIDELYARAPENRIEPRLDATARVLDLLGDPQRSYGVIHITGTNGKSSTARIAASILQAAGLRVGIFTSPHLVRFNERIVIDGQPISDERLIETWRDIAPYVEMVDAQLSDEGRAPLTFFEALTVLAFAAFADAPVDVITLEVGVGGEWDSTNVADGDVAVFAPIDLDHTKVLGDTVAEIAHTKAGIIKPGAFAVTARQPVDALAQLREKADFLGVRLAIAGTDFEVTDDRPAVGGQVVTVRGLAGTYPDLALPLYGDHQAENLALAVAAVEAFLGGGETPLSQVVVEAGVARASSPGRLQIVDTNPTVIIDAAHNPHGARALARGLTENFDFDRTIGVIGVLSDKDAEGLLTELEGALDEVIITASHSPRARDADELAALAVEVFGAENVQVVDDVAEALEEARYIARQGEHSGIVATGSITVIGEVAALTGLDTTAGSDAFEDDTDEGLEGDDSRESGDESSLFDPLGDLDDFEEDE
ncbi:bifunctional folylpolyglutamate synthase/dihydrofolate synthase [Pseudoclavibacter soli]|uniref:bifunctional folylpolyglutamate synthase/dihydrofolate synthase n=1 Tax=Pseudoclavibacter soli TaxID=452623 RepID=UPI000401CE51|nr:folylpolyglutamate synthase/dihydrofolate synthase family protein [Pseudoclavibacter soli]